jgi:hypothetical protein
VEKFIEFAKVTADENLMPKQVSDITVGVTALERC